ncbi:MAG: DUF1330 domain-containing protein [bacterium]
MSAFVVVHINVKDPEKFKAYSSTAPATFKKYGGEFLIRGKVAGVLAGEHGHKMAAVIKFPDQAALQEWYNCEAYQALIPNRDEAADMVFISCDEPPA